MPCPNPNPVLYLYLYLYICFPFLGDRIQEFDKYRHRYGRLLVFPPISVSFGDRQHGSHGVWGACGVLSRPTVQVRQPMLLLLMLLSVGVDTPSLPPSRPQYVHNSAKHV